MRVSLLVQEPGDYTVSLFGTSNSGGTLLLTVDDYASHGTEAVGVRTGERGGEGPRAVDSRILGVLARSDPSAVFSPILSSPWFFPPSRHLLDAVRHSCHSPHGRVPSMVPLSRHRRPPRLASRPGSPHRQCHGDRQLQGGESIWQPALAGFRAERVDLFRCHCPPFFID